MIKAIISDMDGVLYRGNTLIAGAKTFVSTLQKSDIPFLFLTNNTVKTPEALLDKMARLGVPSLSPAHFLTAAHATAHFLKTQNKAAHSKSVYMIGGEGLKDALVAAGFRVEAQPQATPDYVVISKSDRITSEAITLAIQYLHQGAHFIGTNPDVADPIDPSLGQIEAATGTWLAAIAAATFKKPYILGKPNPLMMTLARERLGTHLAPKDILVIGDRMETDILGGMESGMRTALVLSGLNTRSDLAHFAYQPDFVFQDIGELTAHFFAPHKQRQSPDFSVQIA